jgi:hypothetical protein
MTGSLTINYNDGLIIPDPGGAYNQFAWDRTPAIGGDQLAIRGSSTRTTGEYNIFKVNDRFGSPIAWVKNVGGFKVTDAIVMLDSGLLPTIRFDYLNAGNRGVEALVFGRTGSGGYSVTHTPNGGSPTSYTVDSYAGSYVRLQDNGYLRSSPNITVGSENTSLGRSDVTIGYGIGTASTSGIKVGNASIYVGGDGLWYSDNWGSFTAKSMYSFTTLGTSDGNISAGGTGTISTYSGNISSGGAVTSVGSITAGTGLIVTTGGASITGDTTSAGSITITGSTNKLTVPTTSAGATSIVGSGMTTGLRWGSALGMVFVAGGADKWRLATSGNLLPSTSSTVDIGATSAQVQNIYLSGSLGFSAGSVTISYGTTGPESVVTAGPGSLYMKSNGTAWVKSSGTGSTGWKQITAV